jgi:hypothetical protein
MWYIKITPLFQNVIVKFFELYEFEFFYSKLNRITIMDIILPNWGCIETIIFSWSRDHSTTYFKHFCLITGEEVPSGLFVCERRKQVLLKIFSFYVQASANVTLKCDDTVKKYCILTVRMHQGVVIQMQVREVSLCLLYWYYLFFTFCNISCWSC